MAGKECYTWFKGEDAESRKILYQLENLGIAKLITENIDKPGWYYYKWELTEKGKELVKKNKGLWKLWKEGKVIEFYNTIKKLLENNQ